MPTYQYACPDCGHQFERAQRFTDEPIRACPSCEGVNVHRVVGKVAVTFKGSGWYVTDSKKLSANGSSKSDDKSGGSSESAKPAATEKAETAQSAAPAAS